MPRTSQFAFRLQVSEDARPATNPVADLHLQRGGSVAQNVHPRTELDQPHTLATLQPVANFGMENDPSRQQSGDLFEDNHLPIAFHADNILLILLGRGPIHSVQKLPALIAHLAHHSRNRRTVHVHIENAQEDADTSLLLAAHGHE